MESTSDSENEGSEEDGMVFLELFWNAVSKTKSRWNGGKCLHISLKIHRYELQVMSFFHCF